jgi:hypothetical protein
MTAVRENVCFWGAGMCGIQQNISEIWGAGFNKNVLKFGVPYTACPCSNLLCSYGIIDWL